MATTLYTVYEKRWDHGRISAHVMAHKPSVRWEWKDGFQRVILSTPWSGNEPRAHYFWRCECCDETPCRNVKSVDEAINRLVVPKRNR